MRRQPDIIWRNTHNPRTCISEPRPRGTCILSPQIQTLRRRGPFFYNLPKARYNAYILNYRARRDASNSPAPYRLPRDTTVQIFWADCGNAADLVNVSLLSSQLKSSLPGYGQYCCKVENRIRGSVVLERYPHISFRLKTFLLRDNHLSYMIAWTPCIPYGLLRGMLEISRWGLISVSISNQVFIFHQFPFLLGGRHQLGTVQVQFH